MPMYILHKNVRTSPQCSSEKLGTNQWQELTHVGITPWRDCIEKSARNKKANLTHSPVVSLIGRVRTSIILHFVRTQM